MFIKHCCSLFRPFTLAPLSKRYLQHSLLNFHHAFSAAIVLWKYFTRSTDKTLATYQLCNEKFTYTSGRTTSNFNNHLHNKHPALKSSEKSMPKQTSMNAFVSTPVKKMTKSENEKITRGNSGHGGD